METKRSFLILHQSDPNLLESWDIANPPTYSATPVLRAGFTQVLVTGILIK
jgi:hypothetical protein